MTATPIPDNDAARVAAVRGYEIFDTPPDPAYDGITELMAQVYDCPIAVIRLIDETQDFYKSTYGGLPQGCPSGGCAWESIPAR